MIPFQKLITLGMNPKLLNVFLYQLLLWNLSIVFIIRLFITPTCPQYWLFVENDWHWIQVDTEWRNTDWCVNNLDMTSTRPLWLDFSAFTAWITSKSTLLSPFFCFSPQVGHSRRVMSISLKPYVYQMGNKMYKGKHK